MNLHFHVQQCLVMLGGAGPADGGRSLGRLGAPNTSLWFCSHWCEVLDNLNVTGGLGFAPAVGVQEHVCICLYLMNIHC